MVAGSRHSGCVVRQRRGTSRATWEGAIYVFIQRTNVAFDSTLRACCFCLQTTEQVIVEIIFIITIPSDSHSTQLLLPFPSACFSRSTTLLSIFLPGNNHVSRNNPAIAFCIISKLVPAQIRFILIQIPAPMTAPGRHHSFSVR